jgi:CBS domain-containing protein
MTGDGPNDEAWLVPVRRRVVVLDTGERLETKTVHCPLRGLRPVDACSGCERLRTLEAEVLRCNVQQPVGATVTVDEALGSESWCLDPEVPATDAIALLEARGLSSAPVVDDAGVLIGIVRLDALVQLDAEAQAIRRRHPTADDAVTDEALEPALAVLSDDEPLANAAEKMRLHHVSELPVVDPRGVLVGVLTSTDLLAYFARRTAT